MSRTLPSSMTPSGKAVSSKKDVPAQARRQFRRTRRALAGSEQHDNALAVSRIVARSPLLFGTGAIGLYFANITDGELDTLPLMNRLWAMSKTIAVPVVAPNHPTMDFYRLTDVTNLVRNRFGILEPAPGSSFLNPLRFSLMFLPLVSFDDHGNRMGMGLGFYDRYLGRITPRLRPRLIGLAHEVQHSRKLLERKPWDVPLDGVITEAGWRSFGQRFMV